MGHLVAGKYELLEEIRRDAAGAAYKARHTLLGSVCTVIVLPERLTEDPEQLARVQRTVRRASELRHDNIVPVLDFGQEAGRYHVVEGFVAGEPLDRMLGDGNPLSPAEVLRVARQLADALAYAHDRGVIHGAVTPASVLVERSVPPHAMLSGFVTAGLSAELPVPPSAVLPYSAPERLVSREKGTDIDARVDVFALGLLIFEMFEGRPFFSGTGEGELVDLLLHGPAPFLPQFSRIVPAGVSALVARAIRRSPAERPQSMAQVRRDIDACLERLERKQSEATVRVPPEASAQSPDPTLPSVTPGAPAQRPKIRVAVGAVGASRGTSEPIIPRRVLMSANPKGYAPRRRISLAAGALVAAAMLALGALLFRPARTAPAASDRLPIVPRARVDASTPPAPPASPDMRAPAVPGSAEAGPFARREEHEAAPASGSPAADVDVPREGAVSAADPDAARGRGLVDAREQNELPAAKGREPSAVKSGRHVAPRILSFRPRRRDTLGVLEGDSLVFGVRAADPGPDVRLAYAWFLDGRRVGRQQTWRFVAPPAALGTAHTVGVQVSDGASPKAARVSWRVEVSPRMSDTNVRDWLDRFAGAWERKDIATLRLFGIVTSDAEAEALRKRLSRYDGYRIAIANQMIRAKGKYATVTFDRTELEGRGKTIASRRESYELEKHPSGFIALRSAE